MAQDNFTARNLNISINPLSNRELRFLPLGFQRPSVVQLVSLCPSYHILFHSEDPVYCSLFFVSIILPGKLARTKCRCEGRKQMQKKFITHSEKQGNVIIAIVMIE
jgi:hypothetical protein